jgi:predicted phosphodiesterase
MALSVVVLSDLHANAGALRRALEIAREEAVDLWIVLGDLLTYGVDVSEVLELTDELQQAGAIIIRGNHDQVYMDLAEGRRDYYERLPEWMRESVDFTFTRFEAATFARRYSWCDSHVIDDVLLSHANPYGAGDWRYLNDERDHAAALRAIADRGLRIGVFGHVHRARMFVEGQSASVTGAIEHPHRAVITAGSLGQPRDRDGMSSFLRLRVEAGRCEVELVPVDYDVGAHVAAIEASSMSPDTRRRLCQFFAKPG